MSNWRQVSDIITYSAKGVTPTYVSESSIIVLNQKCIRNNKIDYSFAQYIDDSKKYNEDKYLRIGDVLVNSTGQGTAGRIAMIDFIPEGKQLIVDSHILVLRTKNFYESKCLNYTLFSIENILQTYIDGSTGQGEFDKVRLFNIQVNYPKDKLTQQKIAAVLSALDDKIELNNRINAELEQMAKTLYDYWFVQFDFPDANGKPYKSSGGKMVYNEVLKGKVPEGWEVTTFDDWIAETKAGDWGKDAREGNYTERVYCIRGADINGLAGKAEIKAPERFILKNNLSKNLRPNDFIIEMSGGSPTQSTARIALLTKKTLERFDTGVICSNFCKAVSLKEAKYIFNFQQEWQRLYDSGVFFAYEGKTSGLKNFLFDSFMTSYHIVMPDKKIVEKYYEFVKPLEEKRQSGLQQNQQLATLRDWLLPMLMNGQATVGDAAIEEKKTKLAAEPEVEYGKKNRTASWEFKEAVLISLLTEKFGSEKFPLGRKRYTKLSYLFHRHLEDEAVKQYLRKAAGPYNPGTRYKGPETIAKDNKYILVHKNGQYEGFTTGPDIEKAKQFSLGYWDTSAIDWLEQFRYKKNDELELLATVDNALIELYSNGIEVTVEQMKNIIKREPEWIEKLKKPIFSDMNILSAINELGRLFSYHI